MFSNNKSKLQILFKIAGFVAGRDILVENIYFKENRVEFTDQ